MKKAYYKTSDIAGICGVSRMTVLRWINIGWLKAYRLPSGHYRIAAADYSDFAKSHQLRDFE